MRNGSYEAVLNREGVKWSYVEVVPWDDINVRRGLTNQARLEEAVVPELSSDYQGKYESGLEAPPLVLGKKGNQKLYPLDGNQRIDGCQKAMGRMRAANLETYQRIYKKGHDAYVVSSDDQQVLDRLCYFFNNMVNGRRLSRAECLAHAVTLVRKYGEKCTVAARMAGLRDVDVSQGVQIAEAKDVLAERKAKLTPSFTDLHLRSLLTLRNLGDDVFARAATAVANTGVTVSQAGDLVAKVKKAKDHAQKLNTIAEFESSDDAAARRAETRGGTIARMKPTPRSNMRTYTEKLRNLLSDYGDNKAALLPPGNSSKEFKELYDMAGDVVEGLLKLFPNLNRREAISG